MEFLSQLLSPRQPKTAGRKEDTSQRSAANTTSTSSSDTSPPNHGDNGVDESTPPTVEYEFSADATGQRLQALWTPFEEAFSDMVLSAEEKMAVLVPFADAFVEVYDEQLPHMWLAPKRRQSKKEGRRGKEEQQRSHVGPTPLEGQRLEAAEVEEGDVTETLNPMATAGFNIPPTAHDAKGHPKLLTILVGTFFIDVLARPQSRETTTAVAAAAATTTTTHSSSPLSLQDCREYEQEILRHDIRDFLACHRTLLDLTSPCSSSSSPSSTSSTTYKQKQHQGHEGLLHLLLLLSQLTKFPHNRRFLLHSLGPSFAHFLTSFLLALCRVLESRWRQRGGDERGGDGRPTSLHDDALLFLLQCLLSTVQLFAYAVPGYAHCSWLVEREGGREGGRDGLPPYPWSGSRVEGMCSGNSGSSSSRRRREEVSTTGRMREWRRRPLAETEEDAAQQEEEGEGKEEEEEEEEEEIERSLRSMPFEETWSLVTVQEGVVPALLHVLHLSLILVSSLAASPSPQPSPPPPPAPAPAPTPPSSLPPPSVSSSPWWPKEVAAEPTTSTPSSLPPSSPPSSPSPSCTPEMTHLLLLLQNETVLALLLFLFLHPLEASKGMNQGQMEKDIASSILTAFLTMEGGGEDEEGREDEGGREMGVCLVWRRMRLTLKLLEEWVPVVMAVEKTEHLMREGEREGGTLGRRNGRYPREEEEEEMRRRKGGGGGGGGLLRGLASSSSTTSTSSSSSSSPSSSLPSSSSSPAISVQDLMTVLSHGLPAGLERIQTLSLPPSLLRQEGEQEGGE